VKCNVFPGFESPDFSDLERLQSSTYNSLHETRNPVAVSAANFWTEPWTESGTKHSKFVEGCGRGSS
jgi:hypothetical protein